VPNGCYTEANVRILVSAGEASGDMYAAEMVGRLRSFLPAASFYGCTGPKLRDAGVDTVINSERLSVVGLAEVVSHLPTIYGEYRRLIKYVRQHPPDAALLTDNPDFHLRLARHLCAMGIPVYYLVAPQVWAWRQGRVKIIRERVKELFCLFPFEEAWFRDRGVRAHYIGHPLASAVRPQRSKAEFLSRHQLSAEGKIVALLPGSRPGEARRHLPDVLDSVQVLRQIFAAQFLLGTPKGFEQRGVFTTFKERIASLSIKVIEDETWDVLAHSDLALAASGTVTIEAAALGTPTVAFYRVMPLSWWLGRSLVKVPYLSMVNLVAGKLVIPELIQQQMTPANICRAASNLLSNQAALTQMKTDLKEVRDMLAVSSDPLRQAASIMANGLRPVGN
jgi:lipid-A-disaccharide synthase